MSDAATWSDDRVTTLSKLWLEGLSASQIAKALGGITRNAVIGKVHRLGLSGRAVPSAPGRAPRAATSRSGRRPRATTQARRQRGPRPVLAAAPAPVAETPQGPGLVRDMARLRAHACKWPIGDPKAADFSFCGREAMGRYCGAHEQLAVKPGSAWRADRDPVVKRALAGLV